MRTKRIASSRNEEIDRLIEAARKPDTLPERLREIARPALNARTTDFAHVLEALAENPNTPPDVMVELIRSCPDAFLRNPIAMLLVLECPALLPILLSLSGHLLRREDAPTWLVEQLVGSAPAGTVLHEDACHHVSQIGVCPGTEVMARLRAVLNRLILAAPIAAQEPLIELSELGIAPAWVGNVLPAGPSASPSKWERPRHLKPSPEQLLAFAVHAREPSERMIAASDPQTPSYGLYILANHRGNTAECEAIAANPSAGPQHLRLLAKNAAASVRRAACRAPKADADTIWRSRQTALFHALHPEGEPLARFFALLGSDAAPERLLEAALSGRTWLDRAAAALVGPRDLLDSLVQDGNRLVRAVAHRRMKFREEFLLDSLDIPAG